MKKSQLTKKVLENAAIDLTNVMGLAPPIDTGKKKDALMKDLKSAAGELENGDKLKVGTIEVLKALGVKFVEEGPVAEGEKPTETTPTEDPPPAKKKTAGRFVLEYLCRNPEKTEMEVTQALEDNGYKLSERSVYEWTKDMKNIMEFLQEIGKLKDKTGGQIYQGPKLHNSQGIAWKR